MTQSETTLSCIEQEINAPVKKSIIVLHGLGADGNDFVPVIEELHLPASLGIRFIFPHAPLIPITINNGYIMRAWYDITSPSIHLNFDKPSLMRSSELVKKLIFKENERGIRTEDILLAGFSQGAVLALSTGLFYPERLGGIIALSGYFPLTDELIKSTPHHDLPIFLAHGMMDPIVPYFLGEAAKKALTAAGYQVDWHSYPMAHAVCPQEIKDLSHWLQTKLNK